MKKYLTIENKRSKADRRRYPRFSFHHFIFGGRRKALRRTQDKRGFNFVDEYNPASMGFIILLLILSIIDGFMILYLLDHGAYEVNPVMSFCLGFGPWFFLASKFLLTCFGATCLLVVSNSHVFGGRIQARDIFPAMLVLYLMVMGWNSFIYLIV